MSAGALRLLVNEYAARRGLQVPRSIWRELVTAENKETGRSTVISILPHGQPTAAFGTVMSIDSVNFLKRFAPGRSVIGRALIGRFADEAHVEVRIRADRDPDTGFIDEFAFFVPLKAWEASGVRRGSAILADLRDHVLPTGQQIWLADCVERARIRR